MEFQVQGPGQEMHRFPPGFQPMPQGGMGPMWPPHPMQHHPHMPPGRPGHHPPHPHGPMPPPGAVRMMGPPHGRMHTPPPHMMPRMPPPPPGFMFGHHPNHPNHPNSGFPLNPPFNMPPPPHLNMLPGMHPPPQRPGFPMNNDVKNHMTHQQQGGRGFEQGYQHNNNRQYRLSGDDIRDDYAGLMNSREKQWLLNIQLLQVNTGTPYFDDYYYTVSII